MKIIKAMLDSINRKINSIDSHLANNRSPKTSMESSCLVCHGIKFRIEKTEKKKNKILRRAICLDCGSVNKQIIVNYDTNKGSTTIELLKKFPIMSKLVQHSAVKIINHRAQFIDPIDCDESIDKAYKGLGWYMDLLGLDIMSDWIQIQYEHGVFDTIIKNLEPQHLRFNYDFTRLTIEEKGILKSILISQGSIFKIPNSIIFTMAAHWSRDPDDGSDRIYLRCIEGIAVYK